MEVERGYCTKCRDYFSGAIDLFFIKNRGLCKFCYEDDREEKDRIKNQKPLIEERKKRALVVFNEHTILSEVPVVVDPDEICRDCGKPTKKFSPNQCRPCRVRNDKAVWEDNQSRLENEDTAPSGSISSLQR